MKLNGPIGVYGRSLGGIAATHLAATYKDIVKVLIADRTFYELEATSERMISGPSTGWVFRILSMHWKTLNNINFHNATCFKILTIDPKDDVIDNFTSLGVGVSRLAAKNKYK